jgi:hypothetical protein
MIVLLINTSYGAEVANLPKTANHELGPSNAIVTWPGTFGCCLYAAWRAVTLHHVQSLQVLQVFHNNVESGGGVATRRAGCTCE